MRYEVRQQNGKWMVWDTVNDCAIKGVAGLPQTYTYNRQLHASPVDCRASGDEAELGNR